MTGALPGVDTLPPERLRQKALSQWHTPKAVALRLMEWVGRPPLGWRILEPSAGGGALVRAALAVAPRAEVDVVELDPLWADDLRRIEGVNVECCDYLTRPKSAGTYELALLNPPYEGGKDSAFVGKAMDESRRVVALVRLAMLESQRAHDRVWSRVESGEWALRGMAVFTKRPVFLAGGDDTDGGKTAFAAIKLSRVYGDRSERTTNVEWW